MNSYPLLSIIIPVRNEEKTIVTLLESLFIALKSIAVEIIVVENNSTDNSYLLLEKFKTNYPIKLFSKKELMGKGDAIIWGLRHATGEFALIQDGDLEYNVNDILPIYSFMLNENKHVVFGNRFHSTHLFNSPAKVNFIGNKIITTFFNLVHRSSISDVETCYKFLKLKNFPIHLLKSKCFEIEIELTYHLNKIYGEISEFPISYTPRSKKEGKKIGFYDGLSALYYILYYRFRPEHNLVSSGITNE